MKWNYSKDQNLTCLQGYIDATYHQLVCVFGQPNMGPSDKILTEWCLKFEDGTVATIYCWKQDTIPMGQYLWHIGGLNKNAVKNVLDTFWDKGTWIKEYKYN